MFRTNLAHAIFMQGPTSYDNSLEHYEGLLKDFEMEHDLLKAETIVLANMCVCYIVRKQTDKTSALIAKIEQ